MIRVTRETHEADASFCASLARAGGVNPFGDPNFRAVWGGSRLGWIGGRWIDRDAHGNVIRERIELRQEPKYIPANRWHIERWMPPGAYGTREEWYTSTIETENGIRIPALGPYPSRGDWEHCFTLEEADGDFMPLSPAVCEWVVRAIEWTRRMPREMTKLAIAQREANHEREWERIADDVLDDAIPAFHGQTFV